MHFRAIPGALTRAAFVAMLVSALAHTSLAQNDGTILGVVYNTAGDLATDAEVRVVGLGYLAAVDDEGRFTFGGLPDGAHVLEAVSPRWGRGILEVSVIDGQTREVVLEVVVHVDLEEVVVSAGPVAVTRSGAVQPADALSHQDLVDASEESLGETLKGKVGITSTYFGPGASRPVIRGVGGNRVSVLQQGLTVADVSDISPDHAPAVEALLTDRIEVIRGPATLLYGSSAIGGVVNMYGGRVPTEKPTSPFAGTFIGRYSSVSQGRTGALKLRGHMGGLVWSLNGLARATSELRVPAGSIEEEDNDDHGDDHDDDDNGDGHDHDHGGTYQKVENSDVSLTRGSFGLAYVGSWGHIGAAVSLHETGYGLPGHAHHHDDDHNGDDHDDDHDDDNGDDHDEEEEGVRVDLGQTAIDLEGLFRLRSSFLRNVRVRFGTSDYAHDELEGDEVGTTFENDLVEGRLELDHVLGDGFTGVVGVQLDQRKLALSGEEAFMPGSTTDRLAVFLLERMTRGSFGLEAGLRIERSEISPDKGRARSFSAVSLGGGINYRRNEQLSLSVGVARSTKVPDAGELYADGLHVATQAYEIGDENLNVETALSLDLSAHLHHEKFEATASVFSNRYSDFIYLQHTSEKHDETDVYRVSQGSASFTGFELEGEFELFHQGYDHVALRILSDYTRAQRTDNDEPLPRIPPFRIGGELTYDNGSFELSAGVRSVGAQKRVAEHEETTDGYLDVSAGVQYRFFPGRTGHVISLQGRNLTNAVGRPHTSFVKEMIPLPGRDFRLTYRLVL